MSCVQASILAGGMHAGANIQLAEFSPLSGHAAWLGWLGCSERQREYDAGQIFQELTAARSLWEALCGNGDALLAHLHFSKGQVTHSAKQDLAITVTEPAH